MKYALAFPGQGTLHKHLLSPSVRQNKLFLDQLNQIDEVLGEKFSENLYNVKDDWLMNTENAQPAILVTSMISLGMSGNMDAPAYLLGHSLGEYTALTASGIFDLPTAVTVVRKRGELLNNLFQENQYGMTALLLSRQCEFDRLISEAESLKILATINTQNQVVISGSTTDLSSFVKSQGKQVLKAVPLPVRIPFHHHLLSAIESRLQNFIDSQTLGQQKIPIISNATGLPSLDRDQSIRNAVSCNSKPVQWKKSLEYLEQRDVGVVTIGPGNVLEGFMRGSKIPYRTLELC